MPDTGVTTESVERALVAPVATFDEPPAETTEQLRQVETESTTTEGEQPDAAPQQAEGETATEEGTEQQTEEEQALGYEDLLPARQATRKNPFPDELLAVLGEKRWNVTREDLEDPERGPKLKQLLTDNINRDIYFRQQQQQEEIREREREQQAGKKEETTEKTETKEPQQPISFEQMYSTAGQIAEAIVTPQGAKNFAPKFYDAMLGIASLREQENPDPKEVEKAEMALTNVVTQNMLMLMAEVSPHIVNETLKRDSTRELLAPYIDGVIDRREGTVDQESQTYDEARNLLAKEPEFRDIGKYQGEGGPLERAADAYRDEFGKELFDLQFNDRATGKALPPLQNAMQQLRFAVRYMRGMNYQEPEAKVKEALQRGRQLERQGNRQANLGKIAGNGKSSGRFSRETVQTAADEEMGDMIGAFDSANPLSVEAQSNRQR